MNYKLLPAAIAAATVMASSANAGDIVTYGKINLSYVQIEQDLAGVQARDNWELTTNASRIGFKGTEDLGENLKVIYKLEYGIQPDGDGNDEFTGRNSYVGLQGSFGTIVAGEHDTPLKMSSAPVDVFNDYYYADIDYSITGERRENDIIMYKTPVSNGYAATIAIMPGDESGANGQTDNDGFADQISAAFTYQANGLYVALAGDQDVAGADTVRLSASYQLGNLKLGALIQKADLSGTNALPDVADDSALQDLIANIEDVDDEGIIQGVDVDLNEQNSHVISAIYTIDKLSLKAQLAQATNEGSVDGIEGHVDSSAFSIGADYKLSNRTKIYTYYSELSVDKDESINLDNDVEFSATGFVGIEHKF